MKRHEERQLRKIAELAEYHFGSMKPKDQKEQGIEDLCGALADYREWGKPAESDDDASDIIIE